MLKRLRSSWLAGGGAVLLILALSGVVAAASILTAIVAPIADPTTQAVAVDTTATFEDVDGNGIDDDCQASVVADPVAAAAAEAAADLNGDGQISVSEAAQSGRIGGKNCNHGGYVSAVARAFDGTCDGTDPATGTETSDAAETGVDSQTVTTETTTTETTTTCSQETTDATDATTSETTTTETTSSTTCTTTVATSTATTTTETTTTDIGAAPNAHGKLVSDVARSDAVGGKNCNHGGAVSEAAHKDHAAKDAARAARLAARHHNKHGKGHNG